MNILKHPCRDPKRRWSVDTSKWVGGPGRDYSMYPTGPGGECELAMCGSNTHTHSRFRRLLRFLRGLRQEKGVESPRNSLSTQPGRLFGDAAAGEAAAAASRSRPVRMGGGGGPGSPGGVVPEDGGTTNARFWGGVGRVQWNLFLRSRSTYEC